MAKTFAAPVNRLPSDPLLAAALEFLCKESNSLYNCTVYLARQLDFKAGKFSNESADGTLINADCNGAWNIGRKANVTGMQCKPAKGQLTSPKRLRIWNLASTRLAEVLKPLNEAGESPALQSRE